MTKALRSHAVEAGSGIDSDPLEETSRQASCMHSRCCGSQQIDLVCLAMQEPQYGSADVRDLMSRIAASGKPVVSIMNMPPLPFLARISAIDIDPL